MAISCHHFDSFVWQSHAIRGIRGPILSDSRKRRKITWESQFDGLSLKLILTCELRTSVYGKVWGWLDCPSWLWSKQSWDFCNQALFSCHLLSQLLLCLLSCPCRKLWTWRLIHTLWIPGCWENTWRTVWAACQAQVGSLNHWQEELTPLQVPGRHRAPRTSRFTAVFFKLCLSRQVQTWVSTCFELNLSLQQCICPTNLLFVVFCLAFNLFTVFLCVFFVYTSMFPTLPIEPT